ncbi:NACHT domain-containing protein [Micromonospora aurantiaca]|uniref:NACHT domain-containing protein n=1 Tax=Micromonospora aurantiaca (nom. illeg.) TaxID=47850 RepID=UPI0037FB8EFF
MNEFTEHSLPAAVQWLFEANGYLVEGPIHHFGAEVDLVATQLAGFASAKVYIEVTVQYVDTAKYGKDLTKLDMFRNQPGAQRLIVSSKGFTPDVRERAAASGITTMTYEELFRNFEKCEPYINSVLRNGDTASGLAALDDVYEEPVFDDEMGQSTATAYLTDWARSPDSHRWLVVVGEYGTGKTALTRVLQRRWTRDYANGEGTAIPFRIELKDFSKQFDARGLLHHFLDRNELAHLPIQFVESMIAQGRVVLLLDGYDEMAQYLNVRERRACLEALTDLAQGGARGILTSRPNYFTEAEELRVFEALYKRIDHRYSRSTSALDRSIAEHERRVDEALDEFVMKRLERQLKDLDRTQAVRLVERHLKDDRAGAAVVVSILDRVFRTETSREAVSLSGKPVIASYLLEVVEELKKDPQAAGAENSVLSEYQIFELIIDKLMLRDYRRTTEILPGERKRFLQQLAIELTSNEQKVLKEPEFRKVVAREFKTKIKQRTADGVEDVGQALFDDLRSSTTLTRARGRDGFGWNFSHSTLREFLLVEELLDALIQEKPIAKRIPLTETMRLFVRSMPADRLEELIVSLSATWHSRATLPGLDQVFSLAWQGIRRQGTDKDVRAVLQRITGLGLDLSHGAFQGLALDSQEKPVDLRGLNGAGSEFVESDFTGSDLSGASFAGAGLDGCILREASVRGANFVGSYMLDCDLTGIDCAGSDFRQLDRDSTAVVVIGDKSVYLEKARLTGYLRFWGAQTDEVDLYNVVSNDQNFEIAAKIARHLAADTWCQRRGLEQRGASAKNVSYAKSFVKHLISIGYVQEKRGRADLVGATGPGKTAFINFTNNQQIDEALAGFFTY